jgi:hypothetical protein
MNPYEIRLELLKMAKEMMDDQVAHSTKQYWSIVENAVEQRNKTTKQAMIEFAEFNPSPYTPAELMKKATELYTFVEKN